MTNNLYIEKLDWFKQNERPEVVLLLDSNPETVKIIVAWTNLDVKPKHKPEGHPGESECKLWEWLWNNTTYSLKELKEKIGTSPSEVALESKMKPLIGNRIIYPDGTANSFVERYLRGKTVRLFESNPKRSDRKK
jgi:hypothetical protein